MKPKILIAEDDPVSQSLLNDLVIEQGYSVVLAASGDEAWVALLDDPAIQLAFIDWMMPGMDGLALCSRIKSEIRDRYVYSIMITAKNHKDDVIRGLETGADEFISKPVHQGELISRLHVGERVLDYEKRLRAEMRRADDLLLNIFPSEIASRLKGGEQYIADYFRSASILFMDIVGFTDWCRRLEARQMIEQLNTLFEHFDREIATLGLEKIKSMGDAYLVAAGLPNPRPDHAQALARLALSIQRRMIEINHSRMQPWSIRTGIATGPVIAGIIGRTRFIYDVWGDTVNNASRLESAAPHNQILVSEATKHVLGPAFRCDLFGELELKGFGNQRVWELKGHEP